MRVSIIQSCYIPWKGFFDLIGRTDLYVILDGAQYAKRHWHNRNRIMTPNGAIWLTIPVVTKSKFEQPIEEVAIAEPWAEKHWRSIELAYRRSPYFEQEAPFLKSLYERADSLALLTDVNELFLRALMQRLDIKTDVKRDRDLGARGTRGERLLDICLTASASHYLSGPSARDYLDEKPFEAAGIAVEWMTYGPYAVYAQRGPSFDHAVSILDLIFAVGPNAADYWRPAAETALS